MNAVHRTFRRTSILAKLFRGSLMHRVILGQFLILVVFCVSVSANLLWQFTQTESSEQDQGLAVSAETIASLLQTHAKTPEQARQMLSSTHFFLRQNLLIYSQRKGLRADAYGFVIRVTHADGREIYRSTPYPSGFLAAWQPGSRKLNDVGREWHSYIYRSPDTGLLVQVAQTTELYQADIWGYIKLYIVHPLLWFLPLAALITYFVTIRGLQPLRQLASSIAQRHVNDMRPVVNVASYTETRPLVNEINSLLQRLSTTLQRERNFLADAAHELRTPLAVIQAQVHVLRHADSDAAKDAASDELNSGIERAASLIQKLLLSARVSMENYCPRLETMDLVAFVQERMASMSVLAEHKNVEMELTAPQRCEVQLDRETFISAVDNVLDNAIRYTPKGGLIHVTVEQTSGNDKVALRIADSGIGIPAELEERVFERFFRVPGTEQNGSGLGLAIVKRVLALHGGDVGLSLGLKQRGLAVSLTFPVIQ
jgi:signal transduction histidine kinase